MKKSVDDIRLIDDWKNRQAFKKFKKNAETRISKGRKARQSYFLFFSAKQK